MQPLKTIVVCGAGAVGALYASMLHAKGPGSVSLLASGERLERLRAQGVVVNGVRFDLPLRAPGDAAPPADLVLIAVKQHHLAAAVEALRACRVVGPETILLSLLNGISSEAVLGAAFGEANVLPAFVLGTDAVRAGQQITYGQTGKIVFGARSNEASDPRVLAVAAVFNRAGIPHSIPADILREQHWKFMLNVGANQVSAVLRAPYAAFGAIAEVQALTRAAALEAVLVAQAEGVALTAADVEQIFPVLARLAPAGKTSMLQDVEAGRKTEVELFSGTVLALGQRHEIATPVNALLHQQIVALEKLSGAR